MLVYEDAEGAARKNQEREKTLIRTVSEKRIKKHETWREKFMTSLMKAGLHMEEVSVESCLIVCLNQASVRSRNINFCIRKSML